MGQGLEQRDGQAQLTVSSAGHRAGFSVANVNLVSRQPRGGVALTAEEDEAERVTQLTW